MYFYAYIKFHIVVELTRYTFALIRARYQLTSINQELHVILKKIGIKTNCQMYFKMSGFGRKRNNLRIVKSLCISFLLIQKIFNSQQKKSISKNINFIF